MQGVRKKLSVNRKVRRRRTFLAFLSVLILFSLLLFRVWFSSKGVELACEVDRLLEEKAALEEGNRKLLLEVAKLKSPERINRIAMMDLKMVRPSETEVITLEVAP